MTTFLKNDIRSYYGSDGLNYNLGRLNMGGCDFSVRGYTYDDVPGDSDLVHFNLTEDDLTYKVFTTPDFPISRLPCWLLTTF